MTTSRCHTTLLSLLLAGVMLLVPAGGASAAQCADATLTPDAGNISQIRSATRCLINAERTSRGRRALTDSRTLRTPAQRYSERMVREGFFDHVGPDGSTLLSRVRGLSRYLMGARGYSVGENLAWGSHELATPIEILNSWMNSPGHRRNILDGRFRDIGIGIASGAPESVDGPAATYTTVFGQRSR